MDLSQIWLNIFGFRYHFGISEEEKCEFLFGPFFCPTEENPEKSICFH
jgi:hypothetical protein